MSRAKGKLRQHVFAREHFECEYCRSPQKLLSDDLEIDHSRPKTKGGKTIDNNLCAACRKCNELKRVQINAVAPHSGKRVSLYHARTQQWNEHFSFSSDGGNIIGKTPTERATIAALQLNRSRAVLLRHLWIKAGWKPPKV